MLDEWLKLVEDISAWFDKIFIVGFTITASQQHQKVWNEVEEVAKETTLEGKRREAIDVFIALIGYSVLHSFNRNEIRMTAMDIALMFNLTPEMIREKLDINKEREWEKDENGVPQHVE